MSFILSSSWQKSLKVGMMMVMFLQVCSIISYLSTCPLI